MAGAVKSEAVLRANDRKLTPDLRRAKGKFKKFGKGVERDLKKSFGGVRRSIGQIAGFAGVAGFALLGRDVLQFERKLTRLSIQADKSGVDFNKFRKRVTDVSSATGTSRNELIDAAAQFVSLTGDAKTADAALDLFARTSVATGTALTDVARTAASLTKNLGIREVDDMEAALSAMTVQGKRGAIEIKQLSTLMAGLAPQFVLFEDQGVKALKSMGANLQIVQNNFGTAEEAATGFRGLMTALIKNSKRFKDIGVEVFEIREGKKQLRQFDEIIKSITDAGRSTDELASAFGRTEALRAFLALQKDAGAQLAVLKDEAGDAAAISTDFAKFQESAAGKISKAWERVKNQFAKALTPERIELLAKAFVKLADALAFAVDNLGAIVAIVAGGKIAKMAFQFNTVLAGVKGLSPALAGAASRATALGGIIGAAAFGFGIGTALDNALGLSDALSDAAAQADKVRESTGLLRQEAEALGFVRRLQAEAGAPLQGEQKRSARFLVSEAKSKGVLGPGNVIDKVQAKKVAAAQLRAEGKSVFGVAAGVEAGTRELIAAIRFAQQQIKITGEIDFDAGKIKLSQDREKRATR